MTLDNVPHVQKVLRITFETNPRVEHVLIITILSNKYMGVVFICRKDVWN